MLTRLGSSEFCCFSCLGYVLNPALLRKTDEGEEANLHILCGKMVIFLIYLFYALCLQRFFLDRINFFSLEIVGLIEIFNLTRQKEGL